MTHSNLGGIKKSDAKIKQSDAKHVVISISYDGTNVPKALALPRVNKEIIGGAVPNHLISVEGISEEEVKVMLDPKSDVVRADEIKACVVAIRFLAWGRHNSSIA